MGNNEKNVLYLDYEFSTDGSSLQVNVWGDSTSSTAHRNATVCENALQMYIEANLPYGMAYSQLKDAMTKGGLELLATLTCAAKPIKYNYNMGEDPSAHYPQLLIRVGCEESADPEDADFTCAGKYFKLPKNKAI